MEKEKNDGFMHRSVNMEIIQKFDNIIIYYLLLFIINETPGKTQS